MKLLDAIKTICEPIAATNGYSFEHDEARMLSETTPYPCIYLEEYYGGYYHSKYRFDKTIDLCLLILTEAPEGADADVRERLREQMEAEIVYPFISGFMSSALFKEVAEWKFSAAPPRFRKNEVTIMLAFSSILPGCL